MPLVAMHWEHRFRHMVQRYNEIYKVQMPKITPHVCRHIYCSNQAKARWLYYFKEWNALSINFKDMHIAPYKVYIVGEILGGIEHQLENAQEEIEVILTKEKT